MMGEMRLPALIGCVVILLVSTVWSSAVELRAGVETASESMDLAESRSLHAGGPSISFITVGDWGCQPIGSKVDPNQAKVAKGMSKWDPDFIIALGDNFYENGVYGLSDPKFEIAFKKAYNYDSLKKRWMVVVGNHDYYQGAKSIKAQLQFTKNDDRWYFPFTYYQDLVKIDDDTSVHFFMLDTTKILEGDPQQIAWLEGALSKSTAQWRVVVGHHCVRSGGIHLNQAELQNTVKPLLLKYKVDLYISGHDHVLQLIQDEKDGISYCVSGAGCKLTQMKDTAGITHWVEDFGYAFHEISRDHYTIDLAGPSGRVYRTKNNKKKQITLKRQHPLGNDSAKKKTA